MRESQSSLTASSKGILLIGGNHLPGCVDTGQLSYHSTYVAGTRRHYVDDARAEWRAAETDEGEKAITMHTVLLEYPGIL